MATTITVTAILHNDDNAEEQYQNQMANDPNAQMMQGEGEEQYQAEYHEENHEEYQ